MLSFSTINGSICRSRDISIWKSNWRNFMFNLRYNQRKKDRRQEKKKKRILNLSLIKTVRSIKQSNKFRIMKENKKFKRWRSSLMKKMPRKRYKKGKNYLNSLKKPSTMRLKGDHHRKSDRNKNMKTINQSHKKKNRSKSRIMRTIVQARKNPISLKMTWWRRKGTFWTCKSFIRKISS